MTYSRSCNMGLICFRHVGTDKRVVYMVALEVLSPEWLHFIVPFLRNFLETVLETSSAVRLTGGRYESCFIWNWKHISCLLYIPDTRFLTMFCCRFLCFRYCTDHESMF